MFNKKHSEESKRKMSLSRKGKKFSSQRRENMSKAHIGVFKGSKNPMWGKRYRLDPSKVLRGDKHPNWKGGISTETEKIRNSIEYKLWRRSVFERDHFTCIWCGDDKGGNLEADHIKPFAKYPELRFAIDNGRTLCKDCHRTTNTWGNKK